MQKVAKNQSVVELAYQFIADKKEPVLIFELLQSVAKELDIDLNDTQAITKIYMDIILSARFVYVGDDCWNLKEGNQEYWLKDGAELAPITDGVAIDMDEFSLAQFELELDNLDDLEDIADEIVADVIAGEIDVEDVIEAGFEIPVYNEPKFDDDDYDLDLDEQLDEGEEKYNEIMDEYEDMYED